MTFAIERELIRKILQRPLDFAWTVQGFGMMRLYLGKWGRLHIWDHSIQTENVSIIHDHFWDLSSTVVCGQIRNTRYGVMRSVMREESDIATHMMQSLITGEGGGLVGKPEAVYLTAYPTEVYRAGERYYQRNTEVHETEFDGGTVTVLQRNLGGAGEKARVFWPLGESWVSAEPRPATLQEVAFLTQKALSVLENEIKKDEE